MHGYQRFSNLHATMLLAVQETPNAMTGFFFLSPESGGRASPATLASCGLKAHFQFSQWTWLS